MRNKICVAEARILLVCVLLFLMSACWHRPALFVATADTQQTNAAKGGVIEDKELSPQLKINRDTLLHGEQDKIRIDAAELMLLSDEPQARAVLLDLMRQPANAPARSAICKAIANTKASGKPIAQKEDFIEPLFSIFTAEKDIGTAKSAAEATSIFDYEQIAEPLERLSTDKLLPVEARLNVVYALQLQPDMRAIIKLINLLDDPEKQVSGAAAEALGSLGIPLGEDKESRGQIIEELKRKGRVEFLRDWQIRQNQQQRIRELQDELQWWQQKHLGLLEKVYESIEQDQQKGEFLAKYLASSNPSVLKVWALEKVYQGRVGTTSKLPIAGGLESVLISLISDENRDVRHKIAKLLALMGELNAAEPLLNQLKVERDEQVRLELFIALGVACHYSLSTDSGVKITSDIKKETLELAEGYLEEPELRRAESGAEVIRKLLEQKGIDSEQADYYIGLLAERYKQEKGKADGSLRGELLKKMASLCVQSAYKGASIRVFRPLFEQALRDETNLVREAAVDGLIHIDKSEALKMFIMRGLANDISSTIRQKVIALAGQVGSNEDLVWLGEKIGSTAESDLAWQAMLKIFERPGCDFNVLQKWFNNLVGQQSSSAQLSDEQAISFLEITEKKVDAQEHLSMLSRVKNELAELYTKTGLFDEAVERLAFLYKYAQTQQQKQQILGRLVSVHLSQPNLNSVKNLIENCVLEKDFEPNNVVLEVINSYFNNPFGRAEPNDVLNTMQAVKIDQDRPNWQQRLRDWAEMIQSRRGNKPEPENN
ncbi:MAG: hypothetical protein JXB29_04985 [Sedimentisphaerales bacterium]|nr:hypothetical protein [Sedimentisphaerales bacterium]